MNIDNAYWIWVCRELKSSDIADEDVNNSDWINGQLFVLILDRMKHYGIEITQVVDAFKNIVGELKNQEKVIDLELNKICLEQSYSVEIQDRLFEIKEFKRVLKNIDCFVFNLEKLYEPNYYVLFETSDEIVQNFKDIFYKKYIEQEQFILFVEILRKEILNINNKFKQKILENQVKYFLNKENGRLEPINLGYMIYCMEFMNRFVNDSLNFSVDKYISYEDINFTYSMYEELLDWEGNLDNLIDEFNKLERDIYQSDIYIKWQ